MESCPGRYCGRTEITNSSGVYFSECGACHAGFRANESYNDVCTECSKNPSLYDWFYLGFMAMLPLVISWFYILRHNKQWGVSVAIQLLFVLVEASLSFILSLLPFNPKGSLMLTSCPVNQISDWYTVFFNPQIKFVKTIPCAQEAVYPLYSVVFLCYLFSLGLLLIFRPLILYRILPTEVDKKKCTKAIFAALYFHPILVVIHAVGAGLIYYSYPHVTIIATIMAMTVYSVYWEMNTVRKVFGKQVKQNMFIITWHILTLSYAIIALTNYSRTTDIEATNFAYLALAPVPLVYYLITERCTEPNNVARETEPLAI